MSLRYLCSMKLQDETAYIRALISEGEHVRQDFKYEISDSRKIARTLSAFANTEGGRLLIGVKDNGRIAGVRSDEEMYMVEAAARLYCRPEVKVSMSVHRAEGKTVLLAEMPAVEAKPVMACDESNRMRAYVRIADENILATAVHMNVWRSVGEGVPDILTYTEREQRMLDLLSVSEPLSVSAICRCLPLPRRDVVALLARFVRWNLVEMCHDGRNFVYKAME